jgi:hypothetical protein
MDDKTANASVSASQPDTEQHTDASSTQQTPSTRTAEESRQAYGTAKTENLRDSGLWRVILPTFIALCCLALLIIPLAILIPLLLTSLEPGSPSNNAGLAWLWVIMIIVVLGAAAIAIRGFLRIFMTQAQNYSS